MECKLIDVINKRNDIRDITEKLDNCEDLTVAECKIARELLEEYLDILTNVMIKI